MLQNTDPKKLSKKVGPSQDSLISLRSGNRLDIGVDGRREMGGRGNGKIAKSQRWWATPREQPLPDTAGLVYGHTHRACDSMHRTYTSLRKTKIPT